MERIITKEQMLDALRKLEPAFREGKNTAICPICGGTIHIEWGKSYSVMKCETENCFSNTTRGL